MSSPRPVESPSTSIRYNCQKICSWLRRPKSILEIRKNSHFSRRLTSLLFTSFSNTLLTIERRLTGQYLLAVDLSPIFWIEGPAMRPSNNLENETASDTYWIVQLVCIKIQAHSSIEPPPEYYQDQMPLTKFVMNLFTILGVTEILCSFKLVLEHSSRKQTKR